MIRVDLPNEPACHSCSRKYESPFRVAATASHGLWSDNGGRRTFLAGPVEFEEAGNCLFAFDSGKYEAT